MSEAETMRANIAKIIRVAMQEEFLRGHQWDADCNRVTQRHAVADEAAAHIEASLAQPVTADGERAYAERAGTLFAAIAHGDEVHREWLREAINNHFAGRPVPTVRSLKDAQPATAEVGTEPCAACGRAVIIGHPSASGFLLAQCGHQIASLDDCISASCEEAILAAQHLVPPATADRQVEAVEQATVRKCIHILRGNFGAGRGREALDQRNDDIAILETLLPQSAPATADRQVEQVDRDAAADHTLNRLTPKGRQPNESLLEIVRQIRSGEADDSSLVRLLARHRRTGHAEVPLTHQERVNIGTVYAYEAGHAEAMEQAARIADDVAHFARRGSISTFAAEPDKLTMKAEAAEQIAAAIRSNLKDTPR